MAKKIVFQFVDSEIMHSLFFDDPEDAEMAYWRFEKEDLSPVVWKVTCAKNAAGDKFDIAYKRDLIRWVSLVEMKGEVGSDDED